MFYLKKEVRNRDSDMSVLIHRFVYQVVIPKALAPKELVKVYESGDRVVLPPWDPMVGMLHRCSTS